VAESLGALAELVPRLVELVRDRTQPLALVVVMLVGGDEEERVLLPDQVLDPREEAGLGRRGGRVRNAVLILPTWGVDAHTGISRTGERAVKRQ
jgi:hypothetical protein